MKKFVEPARFKNAIITNAMKRKNSISYEEVFQKIQEEPSIDKKTSLKMNTEINKTSRNWHLNEVKAITTKH